MRLPSLSIFIMAASLLGMSTEAARIEGRVLGATFRGRVTRDVSMKTRILLSNGQHQTLIHRDGCLTRRTHWDLPTRGRQSSTCVLQGLNRHI
ncbi:MAG: hypothetical protein J3Q66DRAFT_61846 [Benniella sp.]|nr:MAG: hypothetical protein J3Q66DRAFT_61846 [Benniella sp.]